MENNSKVWIIVIILAMSYLYISSSDYEVRKEKLTGGKIMQIASSYHNYSVYAVIASHQIQNNKKETVTQPIKNDQSVLRFPKQDF